MLWPLDVLIVDDTLDSVRFLTEFLTQRCRRVDTAATAQAALAAAVRRRATHEPYQVVFVDYVMSDMDGVQLAHRMQAAQDDLSFVFLTAYRSLNPSFESDAAALGAVDILDKPIDLRRVEQLLGNTARFRRRKEAEQKGEQPFFGTGRILKPAAPAAPSAPPSSALEPRRPAAPDTAGYRAPDLRPGDALEPRQHRTPQPVPQAPITGYQRRPSGIIPMTGSTARLRRGLTPLPDAGGGAPGQPVTGFTARVRRGLTGSEALARPQGAAAATRQVACATCRKPFAVPVKAESFTTVCIHCGQLQRVDPQ